MYPVGNVKVKYILFLGLKHLGSITDLLYDIRKVICPV